MQELIDNVEIIGIASEKANDDFLKQYGVDYDAELHEEDVDKTSFFNERYDYYFDALFNKKNEGFGGTIELIFATKDPTVKIPQYQTKEAAGLDIHSREDVVINPGQRHLFKTGLYTQIPKGYELQVRPRSGLAFKKGVTVLNSPGTIDSDFRGEIGVILVNTSKHLACIMKDERIAQLVLKKVPKANVIQIPWEEYQQDTERGEGGFGSTDDIKSNK